MDSLAADSFRQHSTVKSHEHLTPQSTADTAEPQMQNTPESASVQQSGSAESQKIAYPQRVEVPVRRTVTLVPDSLNITLRSVHLAAHSGQPEVEVVLALADRPPLSVGLAELTEGLEYGPYHLRWQMLSGEDMIVLHVDRLDLMR